MDPDSERFPAWKKFEEVVEKLLRSANFEVSAHVPRGDRGYDFDATMANGKWAIEVKYYRSPRAQAILIEAAAARVANNGALAQREHAALVVSAFIPGELRIALEQKFQITFIDRADLSVMAAKHPDLLEDLNSVLEARSDLSDELLTENGSSSRWQSPKAVAGGLPISDTGKKLAERLSSLAPGRDNALNYEKLGLEILKFLFGSDLVGWVSQNTTDDELSRFDCVCRAKPTHEFWRFVIEDLGSRYVIFEFKNYKEPISQGQVLSTEKYLLAPALRRVAFVLTREGAKVGAMRMAKGAMREHGKFMLILDDAKIVDMLNKRDGGADPTDALFELADEFMLTLSR